MGFAENFEDLQIWQRSRVMTNEIYDAFEKIRDFDFRRQIQSAAVSVIKTSRKVSSGGRRKILHIFWICPRARPAKFAPCSILPKTVAT